MKRDFNLFRSIALTIEESTSLSTDDVTVGHLYLMADAGLIEAEIRSMPTMQGQVSSIGRVRLTNKGHDFLEMARDLEAWQSLPKNIPFGVLMTLLERITVTRQQKSPAQQG